MPEPKTLLVEDDSIAREGMNVVLRHHGYEVVTAANGEEGLQALRSVRPDLVLLDMMMPVLDGWHFLERLKAENASTTVPIIVVTATTITRAWAEDHGCCGFIQKPVELDNLLSEIKRCLRA